jgi:hypothetical protein
VLLVVAGVVAAQYWLLLANDLLAGGHGEVGHRGRRHHRRVGEAQHGLRELRVGGRSTGEQRLVELDLAKVAVSVGAEGCTPSRVRPSRR